MHSVTFIVPEAGDFEREFLNLYNLTEFQLRFYLHGSSAKEEVHLVREQDMLKIKNNRESYITTYYILNFFIIVFSVVLPRLAFMAASNNHVDNNTRRLDVAVQLFEAYSALSCCCIL